MVKKWIVGCLGLSNLIYSSENWEHILSNIEYYDQERRTGTLYDTNEEIKGRLYYSLVTYQFQGANSSGNIDSNEKVRITVGGISTDGYSTADDGGYISAEDLQGWADENADALQKAVFGSDPIASVSGTTASISNISNTIMENTSSNRKEKSESTQKEKSFNTDFSTLVVMDSEKASIRNNGIAGTASAFKFSYDKELKSGNEMGALFAYKNTKASDTLSSKAKSFLLAPYYKYYKSINDDIEVIGVANIVTSYKQMKSSLFPEGFEYIEYGAGLSAIPNYYLNDKFTFRFPIGFQSINKHIQDKVPEDIGFIVTAINDIGFQHSFNYGLGIEYALKPNWIFTGNILQTKMIGSDDLKGKAKATYYSLNTTYYSEYWNYVLGYKTVKDVSDYAEDAYMLSIQYNW